MIATTTLPMKLLRIVILAGTGLLLASAVALVLWKAAPRRGATTVSLAERIATNRTQLFIRSPDRDDLTALAGLFAPDASLPSSLTSLPPARSYEAALLGTGSGGDVTWIIVAHTETGRTVSLPKNPASLLLPLKDGGASLGRDRFFTGIVTLAHSHILFVRTPTIRTDSSSAGTITQALLRDTRQAIAVWEGQEGTIALDARGQHSLTAALPPSAPWTGTGTLLELRIARPYLLLSTLADTLKDVHPALWEGIAGIGKQEALQTVGERDSSDIGRQLFSNPASLVVEGGEGEDAPALLLQGSGKPEDVATWRSALEAAGTTGIVTSWTFGDGNVRTSVGVDNKTQRTSQIDGWTMSTVGARSTVTVATNGGAFVYVKGFLPAAPETLLAPAAEMQQRGILALAIDTQWGLGALARAFPDIGAALNGIVGILPGLPRRLAIDVSETALGIEVHWRGSQQEGSTGNR